MKTGIKIVATGAAVPERVVTNDDLSTFLDTSDEWIRPRTGIESRHISTGENTADLCTRAAQQMLTRSGWDPASLDLIVVGTMSPDSCTPATAAIVQGRIGAVNAACFDLSAACSGFVYGLQVAQRFLATGMHRALVIGGEVLSKLVDWQDRRTAVLFGDGAAGVLLEKQSDDDAAAFLAGQMWADGTAYDKLQAGQTASLQSFPPQHQRWEYAPFTMDGHAVYRFATNEVARSLTITLDAAGMTADNVDYFLLHQANYRIIDVIAKKIGQPVAKFPVNIAKYGNTSAASIPLLLDELVTHGTLHRGAVVALSGFGGGLTVGTQIIRF